ncbi:3305_t:CDS:2, partial [Racocetra persica]
MNNQTKKISQSSFSLQYYEILQQIKEFDEFYKDKSIEEMNKQLDQFSVTIPDNFIINKVKLDEKYRIKSKEHLKDFNNDGLYREWLKVKDKEDTGRVVLYLFGRRYYKGSSKLARSLTHQIAENAKCSVF